MFKTYVRVRVRQGVPNPENENELRKLKKTYPMVLNVDKQKYFEIEFSDGIAQAGRNKTKSNLYRLCNRLGIVDTAYWNAYEETKILCEGLLARDVHEEFSFHIERVDSKGKTRKSKQTPWFYFDKGEWKSR